MIIWLRKWNYSPKLNNPPVIGATGTTGEEDKSTETGEIGEDVDKSTDAGDAGEIGEDVDKSTGTGKAGDTGDAGELLVILLIEFFL